MLVKRLTLCKTGILYIMFKLYGDFVEFHLNLYGDFVDFNLNLHGDFV